MANYITIDGGTTNTRISLVVDKKIVDTLKFNVGAKAGIDDELLLRKTVKNGITTILSKNNMIEDDVFRILASGMITSEFGLYKLEHIPTPAGINELKNAMTKVVLEDISKIPFVFMCGVKTNCDSLKNADMMRGEETELMGVIGDGDEECLYIFPGSHSKIIHTDKIGRIDNFWTGLTGEMISAISKNTILRDSVNLENVNLLDDFLLEGYNYCKYNGMNDALFKVRVLKNIFNWNYDQIYSFFLGVILCGEII